jgi:hypothetical protein
MSQSERIAITILKLVKERLYMFHSTEGMTECDSCAEDIQQFLFDSSRFVEK